MARDIDRKKFVDLAEKRVTKTLKDIKLVGNLSNKGNYSYTDQDVKKIYAVLKKAIDEMKVRFDSNGANEEEVFKL
jgi:murein L,D-transpeptidase YafK